MAAVKYFAAGHGAVRWLCAADHGWFSEPLPARAGQGLVRHNTAGRAFPEMAEVLAKMVAAGQGPATDLEAEVRLMVPIIEARAAQHVASMVSARLLRPAGLVAHKLFALCAQELLRISAASAVLGNLFRTGPTRAIVARLRARMATRRQLAAGFPAERQRVEAAKPWPDPANQDSRLRLTAAAVGLPASTAVAPTSWIPRAETTFSRMALLLAAVLAALQWHSTTLSARKSYLAAHSLLFSSTAVASDGASHHAGWAWSSMAPSRTTVASTVQLPAALLAAGPLRLVAAPGRGRLDAAAVAPPRWPDGSTARARPRVAQLWAPVRAAAVALAHVAAAMREEIRVSLRP